MKSNDFPPSIQGKRRSGIICFMLLFFWSLGLSLFSLPVLAADADEIPVPDWVKRVPVGKKMVIKGLPSTVHFFEAEKGLEEVLRFYRQRWEKGEGVKQGYREVEVPPWTIISRLSGGGRYLLTVQAQGDGPFQSMGYLAVADLKGMNKIPEPGRGVPKMKGSQVIDDLTSYDPGKKGRTLLLSNKFSVESNSEYYRNYYTGRGWGTLLDASNDGGQALAFGRFGKEAHIVITHNFDSTQVVINLVEND